MSDDESIRTEAEFEAQEMALWAAVEKMGDTYEERLAELVHLCVEERVDGQIAAVIAERTRRVVGVSKAAEPIEYGYNYNRSRNMVTDPGVGK